MKEYRYVTKTFWTDGVECTDIAYINALSIEDARAEVFELIEKENKQNKGVGRTFFRHIREAKPNEING